MYTEKETILINSTCLTKDLLHGLIYPIRVYLEVPMFYLFTKIDSISTSELEAKLREPIHLLDVRMPTEFHRGHIKNAKNVPLTKIGSYTPATKETLYVICQSGVRSKIAAKKLKKKGYDVINVRGGMSAWTGKII